MEIEPDGQQFLNARKAETGSDLPPPPSPPPPDPSGGGSRTTIFVIAAIVAVVAVGGVLFLTLTGDSGERRELETGGDSEIELRERAEATTTTEPPETTTTEPPPTTATTVAPVLPGDPAVPFPDPGQIVPGAVTPGVQPATPACPGGGISMTVGTSSYTSINGNTAKQVDIQGTARNDTNAPVTLDLTLTITHDAGNHPNPWITPVTVSNPTLAPGATTSWTFSGVFEAANAANVSALGGGFRWADPAHASCPTQ